MRVQDLRDNPRDRQRYFYHKRGWAKLFNWEAYFSRNIDGNWFRLRVTLGGENERNFQLAIGLLWFGIYLTFKNLLPESMAVGWYKRGEIQNPLWFEDSHGRDYGFYLNENHLVFMWNKSSSCGGSDKKKYGYSWSCFIDEKIFGRIKYTQGEQRYHAKTIYFPEGDYPISIKLSEDSWKYKRWPYWPLTKVISRAQVEVIDEKGIPVPGKGENSWDCGDTATHSISGPANSVHEAMEMLRSSVNRTRSKYGSGEAMYLKRAQTANHQPTGQR
jgi:hypothetical protein